MVSLLLAKASFVKKANQASKQAIETEGDWLACTKDKATNAMLLADVRLMLLAKLLPLSLTIFTVEQAGP
jgi:hypothetical protein